MEDKYITLTWSFIRDKDTTMLEKLLLMEINNLTMQEHGCIAHNGHFSTVMGIKKNSVSRLISSLEKKGYITSTIKPGSRNFARKITIHKMLFDPSQNVIQPITKCEETKGNITTNIKRTPTLEEISLYVKEKNLRVSAKDFFDYFEAGNWKDSKGNKVKSWKQKLLTWNNHTSKPKAPKRSEGLI